MRKQKVLVIDDEQAIANLIRDYLVATGYEVIVAFNGDDGLERFEKDEPNMVILDIMMPKLDGLEVCRRIRHLSNIPILILTARKEDSDKILGLGLGADDYITKPFSPRELVARVQSHFRRFTKLSPNSFEDSSKPLSFGDLEIDPVAHTVKIGTASISFSVKEFEILYYLALNPNISLSRQRIFENVWGFNEYGDMNTVTVHIRKIREKIESDPSNPRYIQTVWGIGYKFIGGQSL